MMVSDFVHSLKVEINRNSHLYIQINIQIESGYFLMCKKIKCMQFDAFKKVKKNSTDT